MRNVPNRGKRSRKPRRACARKTWSQRPTPLVHAVNECSPRSGLFFTNQIDVDYGLEKSLQLTIPNPYWHEGACPSSWISTESSCPLRLGEFRSKVVRREHCYHPQGFAEALVHFQNEIRTWDKVPGLDHGGETHLLQLPGDPFGPVLVGVIIANEKIWHGLLDIVPLYELAVEADAESAIEDSADHTHTIRPLNRRSVAEM